MLPNTKITVFKNGSSLIEGQEKSDNCYKIKEMGRAAGKVTEEKDKDHTPVYQDVHAKGGRK